mgnify:FL=1
MAATLRQRLPIEIDQTKSAPSAASSDSGSDVATYDESHLAPFTPPTFTVRALSGRSLVASARACDER